MIGDWSCIQRCSNSELDREEDYNRSSDFCCNPLWDNIPRVDFENSFHYLLHSQIPKGLHCAMDYIYIYIYIYIKRERESIASKYFKLYYVLIILRIYILQKFSLWLKRHTYTKSKTYATLLIKFLALYFLILTVTYFYIYEAWLKIS